MCVGINPNEPTPGASGQNEADSNADTCCLGINFVVLSYTNRVADVYPYNDAYKPMTSVPIVTGATTYHHPNGQSYILVINEALFYGTKLKHTLLNPNQIRHYGHGFWDNPYDKEQKLGIEAYDGNIELNIPMAYAGTKLSFTSTAPTNFELNTLPHVELTSSEQWDPENVKLGINEITTMRTPRYIQNVSTMGRVQGFI